MEYILIPYEALGVHLTDLEGYACSKVKPLPVDIYSMHIATCARAFRGTFHEKEIDNYKLLIGLPPENTKGGEIFAQAA